MMGNVSSACIQSPEQSCTVFIVGQQIEFQGKTCARHDGQIGTLV